jgi:hypothetical protein
MDSAAQFLKARWKLLLGFVALLGLALVLLFLSASQSPLLVFATGTNEVAGVRWVEIGISNSSARTYAIDPHTEVMVEGRWKETELMPPLKQHLMPEDLCVGAVLPGRDSIRMVFEVPSESAFWRVHFFCLRKESAREQKMRQWCRRLGLRYPVRPISEHVIEFGE